MLSILKKVLHALEKNEYSAAVGWNVLHMTLFPLQSKSNVSLLIFYLNILSINESRVLKPSTIIILLCSSLQFCQCLLYIFRCSDVRCRHNFSFFLEDWPLLFNILFLVSVFLFFSLSVLKMSFIVFWLAKFLTRSLL